MGSRSDMAGENPGGKVLVEKANLDKLPWNTIRRCSAEVYDWDNAKWDLVMGMWQLDVPPNQIVAVDEKLYSSVDCLNGWRCHIEAYDGKIWNEVDGSHLETLSLSFPISISYVNSPPIKRVYITMARIGTCTCSSWQDIGSQGSSPS